MAEVKAAPAPGGARTLVQAHFFNYPVITFEADQLNTQCGNGASIERCSGRVMTKREKVFVRVFLGFVGLVYTFIVLVNLSGRSSPR